MFGQDEAPIHQHVRALSEAKKAVTWFHRAYGVAWPLVQEVGRAVFPGVRSRFTLTMSKSARMIVGALIGARALVTPESIVLSVYPWLFQPQHSATRASRSCLSFSWLASSAARLNSALASAVRPRRSSMSPRAAGSRW